MLCSGPSDEIKSVAAPSLPNQKDGTPLSENDIKVNINVTPCSSFKNGLLPEDEENIKSIKCEDVGLKVL